MKKLKVVFMGTPEFAVPTLEALIASQHEVVAVYTMPPRPSGRGYRESYSAVFHSAHAHGLNILTPPNFKIPETITTFMAHKADIVVVAAYGLILPKAILEAFKYGAINIHPSKLPKWRGAAPLQHTILAGDKQTSVCIMQMDEGMDTGGILLQRDLAIDDTMTAVRLGEITGKIGAEMTIEALEKIDDLIPKTQSTAGVTYANKIERGDARLDFTKPVRLVHCQVRAFTLKPGAYFVYNNEMIKILDADYVLDSSSVGFQPGEIVDDKLTIACLDGFLQPKLLQREGKKMIYTDAFLRGFPLSKGIVLN
jgi:methionyl-tRNA formyltransferase